MEARRGGPLETEARSPSTASFASPPDKSTVKMDDDMMEQDYEPQTANQSDYESMDQGGGSNTKLSVPPPCPTFLASSSFTFIAEHPQGLISSQRLAVEMRQSFILCAMSSE